jgi:nucleotide-binding universal stress UspA family protein
MLPPTRILAAVDFSDASRAALTMAARLAKQCRAKLHILYGQDPLLAAAAEANAIPLTDEARVELEKFVAATWPAAECAPSLHVMSGSPATLIRNAASREAVDLIVVGSHGGGGAERLFFGSTTEALMRRSEVPVLVVPPSWGPDCPELPDLSGIGPIVASISQALPSKRPRPPAGSRRHCRPRLKWSTSCRACRYSVGGSRTHTRPSTEKWNRHGAPSPRWYRGLRRRCPFTCGLSLETSLKVL